MKPISRLVWKLILALPSSAGALLGIGILEPSCRLGVQQDRLQVMKIAMAVETYQLDTGQLPRHLGELLGANAPGWDGPYVNAEELLDPWGKPFGYHIRIDQRVAFAVGSLGPNGEPDGSKNIDDFWLSSEIRYRRNFAGSPPTRRCAVAMTDWPVQLRSESS